MKAVVIGTGRMGQAIIKALSRAYPREVGLYSRSLDKAKQVIDELGIEAIPVTEDDLFKAEIIIHSLWYEDILSWIERHKEQLKEKILIDICNPFNENFDDFILDYNTSAAEEIQKLIPKTIVAGAFKNTYWVVFDNPIFGNIKSDIYVTCNNDEMRNKVMELLKPLPFRVFDAGTLKNNRTIERMTLLEKELATKAGNHPRVSFHLWGVDKTF